MAKSISYLITRLINGIINRILSFLDNYTDELYWSRRSRRRRWATDSTQVFQSFTFTFLLCSHLVVGVDIHHRCTLPSYNLQPCIVARLCLGDVNKQIFYMLLKLSTCWRKLKRFVLRPFLTNLYRVSPGRNAAEYSCMKHSRVMISAPQTHRPSLIKTWNW